MHGRRPGRWCDAGQTKFNFYFIDFSQLAAGFLTFAWAGGRPASQKNFPPCPVLAQASEIPQAILSLPGRDTSKSWALIVPYPVPTTHSRLRRAGSLCAPPKTIIITDRKLAFSDLFLFHSHQSFTCSIFSRICSRGLRRTGAKSFLNP